MRPVRNRFVHWLLLSLSLVAFDPIIYARAFHDSSWISCGYRDGSYGLGFFGYRIGDHAVELGSLIPVENYGLAGYGLDYLLFKDLSEKTALYGGIGVYRRYYPVDTGNFQGRTEWTYSFGAQHDFTEFLGLGLGYHSIRGANFQIKLGF